MTSKGGPIDVLLIEDDPGDILITREAFEHHKIHNTLHVARDGQEGLDYLYQRGAHEGAQRPDLILMDLNLPKYDGRQLLEQIKSDPDLCFIPLRRTHHLGRRGRHSAQLSTVYANAYVTKPVGFDEFMNVHTPD